MFVNQKYHYLCLACRRCVKGPPHWEFTLVDGREIWHTPPIPCAHCGGEMLCLGKKFAAPRRRDNAQWKKLQWMIDNGWRGYNWPTAPAMNLRGVKEVLRAQTKRQNARLQREKELASFDQIGRRARRNARNARTAHRRARLEWGAQKRYQDAVLARVNRPKN